MNLTKQDFLKAAALVRKSWCKSYYACDKDGNKANPWDRKARSFCMIGALLRITKTKTDEGRMLLLDDAMGKISRAKNYPQTACGFVSFNDRYANSAEEVAVVLEQAAELCE